jgi:hypothetical protein
MWILVSPQERDLKFLRSFSTAFTYLKSDGKVSDKNNYKILHTLFTNDPVELSF